MMRTVSFPSSPVSVLVNFISAPCSCLALCSPSASFHCHDGLGSTIILRCSVVRSRIGRRERGNETVTGSKRRQEELETSRWLKEIQDAQELRALHTASSDVSRVFSLPP
mmetsp:Transcript_7919/g.18044  ORF Transcript_7919/g.18044 Transcript_7919/m.18044 type:complete len:110 (-) Transcript_7919:989-1318(-)